MSRRSQLAIVLIIGLLLLGIGLYILLQPILSQRQSAQAPALPSAVQPYSPPGQASTSTSTATPTPVVAPSTPVDAKIVLLEQKARATVERIGSGSSGDGFLGYADVMDALTSAGRTAMLAEQKALQKAHPSSGPAFGITTHAVSSHVKNGTIGNATLIAEVQAIQNEDAGDPTKPTARKGKIITVTLVKQSDGGYLIDSLNWADKQI